MEAKISDIIQELRKDCRLTQSQLGKIIGVGYGAIHGYESGKSLPSIDSLILLANYFNVNADYLIGRTTVHVPWKKFMEPIETANKNYSISEIVDKLRDVSVKDRTALLVLLDSISSKDTEEQPI